MPPANAASQLPPEVIDLIREVIEQIKSIALKNEYAMYIVTAVGVVGAVGAAVAYFTSSSSRSPRSLIQPSSEESSRSSSPSEESSSHRHTRGSIRPSPSETRHRDSGKKNVTEHIEESEVESRSSSPTRPSTRPNPSETRYRDSGKKNVTKHAEEAEVESRSPSPTRPSIQPNLGESNNRGSGKKSVTKHVEGAEVDSRLPSPTRPSKRPNPSESSNIDSGKKNVTRHAEGVEEPEEPAGLSDEERIKLAEERRTKGNKAFAAREFENAVECYTKAIEISPEPDAALYSNRAACYLYFTTPQYEKVVEDCTKALEINPKYEGSIQRRGEALEKLGRLEEALRDFTAETLLHKLPDTDMDRVLKDLSEKKAKEIYSNRERHLPPKSTVDAYFLAFQSRTAFSLPTNLDTEGDETLKLALEAHEEKDHTRALKLASEALAQGISSDKGKAQALNLRATYKFLCGDLQGAQKDLEEAMKTLDTFSQSWVNNAVIYSEQGDSEHALVALRQAEKREPKNPDIYYHRGQVLFKMSEFDEAAKDYYRATELDPTHVLGYVQLARTQSKLGQYQPAMQIIEKAIEEFPHRREPHECIGDVLMDQGRFEDAIDKFNHARSSLGWVKMGRALFEKENNFDEAEHNIQSVLTYDDDCEAAVETLAEINLRQGNVQKAGELFRKQVDLVRKEADIAKALRSAYKADALHEFAKDYPGEFASVYPDAAQVDRHVEH